MTIREAMECLGRIAKYTVITCEFKHFGEQSMPGKVYWQLYVEGITNQNFDSWKQLEGYVKSLLPAADSIEEAENICKEV